MVTRSTLTARAEIDEGDLFPTYYTEAGEPADVPEGLATVADALLEGQTAVARSIRAAFGAFDSPFVGEPQPIRFLEAIAMALGGENLKTPLPQAISEGFATLAESIDRLAEAIGDSHG